MNKDFVSEMNSIVARNSWTKLTKILDGGEERSDSSLSAIRAYDGVKCNLIFHDAVRPLVSQRIIADVVDALKKNNAVAVSVPSTDTIVEVDESGLFIGRIPKRSMLRCQQTPQAFNYEIIAKAYKFAMADSNFVATDDCGVVAKYLPDEKIFIVDGDDSNIKVTYRKDLKIMEMLVCNNMF